ncbi:hypothetical protein FB45DRAFT_177490 [Roridomyces roridus]|uniref:F-box domain-containing protein n=1 Tax=Roridomyces roridus TaxID=1738132 RepID=A0AAD7FW27_9AGAR|nr:hypothetical protein FB45DRAFT_177490 [Roridomyces roridus]
MRRLPNELLADIFTMVNLRRGLPEWTEPWSKPPWTLTCICRRWAAVTMGTPSLWSGLFLNLDLIGVGRGAVKMTELFHQRSGSMPLTVKIVGDWDRETNDVLDVALAHCERWRYVDLNSPRGSPILFQIAGIRGRLPNLTTLKIFAELDNDAGSSTELRDVFAVAPNLTAVHTCVENVEFSLAQAPFDFPWCQLTTLSISFTRSEEALPIIPQLSSIVHLRVQFTDADPFPAQSPITLPHLRALEIKMQDSFDPLVSLSLLRCSTAPLVEHLGIQNEAHKDTILSFIARSGCKLKSFHFLHDTGEMSPRDFLSLVHAMPCLRDPKFGDVEETSGPPPNSPVSIT